MDNNQSNLNQPGKIVSADLTVNQTEEVRDFYKQVIGWEHNDVEMGGYNDYLMTTKEGEPVAGVCHPVGSNSDLPPVWLVYFQVADLPNSLDRCRELGGKVLIEPDTISYGSYAVIEYPEGAICALTQMAKN